MQITRIGRASALFCCLAGEERCCATRVRAAVRIMAGADSGRAKEAHDPVALGPDGGSVMAVASASSKVIARLTRSRR